MRSLWPSPSLLPEGKSVDHLNEVTPSEDPFDVTRSIGNTGSAVAGSDSEGSRRGLGRHVVINTPRPSPSEHGHGKIEPERDNSDEDVRLKHPMVIGARTSSLGVWGRASAVHSKYLHESRTAFDEHGLPVVKYLDLTDADPTSANEDDQSKAENDRSPDVASHFLLHFKLYLLAEQYGCEGLQALVLQKLRDIRVPEGHSDPTSNLVRLIKVVYQLQPANNTVQQFRDVVLELVVNRMSELQKDEQFKAFVREGGPFVDDLLSRMTRTGLSLN